MKPLQTAPDKPARARTARPATRGPQAKAAAHPHTPSGEAATVADPSFRWTRQRREVYDLLMGERDHPTAAELYMRAKESLPHVSLATIYNCLETLTKAGLVRQVNFERSPSRYCPNQRDHAHLYDVETGEIHDVELRPGIDLNKIFVLPRGLRITEAEISLKGRQTARTRRDA